MVKLIKNKNVKQPISLRKFNYIKNKILIWHDKGGLGDVLMQRMIFDDLKKECGDAELYFACLPEYIDAAKDHPAIHKVISSKDINLEEYCIHYNTCVTHADRFENFYAPNCKEHRSDIWAKICGINLISHEMNFVFEESLLNKCQEKLNELKSNNKPVILLAPYSKMATKCLLPNQINCIKNYLKDYNLLGIHSKEINGLKGIYNVSIKEWMCYIKLSDYVISVDTAAFHMAGGLKKPLVGIFTFADGKTYGKYFDFILVQKHRDNGNWDCGPCFKFANCPKCNKLIKPCLTEITEDELIDGVKNMINKWKINE